MLTGAVRTGLSHTPSGDRPSRRSGQVRRRLWEGSSPRSHHTARGDTAVFRRIVAAPCPARWRQRYGDGSCPSRLTVLAVVVGSGTPDSKGRDDIRDWADFVGIRLGLIGIPIHLIGCEFRVCIHIVLELHTQFDWIAWSWVYAGLNNNIVLIQPYR